ncbi:hypothetical protein ACMUMQ_00075 [Marinomonas sp. 2405UD66-6]|uniref:hypothetical protein n=1 Tax=Marinomonas sp. 2405UD66-6 TaxID=3391834 RepID=UPI0039C9AC76
MKAIKLTSIFALTSVAAAISTTSIAAEPVFSGTASAEYVINDGTTDELSYFGSYEDNTELEFNIDTEIVHFEVEINNTGEDEDGDDDKSSSTVDIEEAYLTLGALTIGDVDGSIADNAFDVGAQLVEADFENIDGLDKTDWAIIYEVSKNLDVAVEFEEGYDGVGFAVAYKDKFGDLGVEIAGGTYSGSNDTDNDPDAEHKIFTFGLTYQAGPAKLFLAYLTGTEDDVDKTYLTLGTTIEAGDFTIGLNHNQDLDNEATNETLSNVEAYVEYALPYEGVSVYATALSGNLDKDSTTESDFSLVGIKAEF